MGQPMGQPGMGQPGMGGPFGAPQGGGGFLGTALSTAAGVAGGMMLGSALSNAFKGSGGHGAMGGLCPPGPTQGRPLHGRPCCYRLIPK